MSVLDGPRQEKRRIQISGEAVWATMSEDGMLILEDGSSVSADEVTHLPPCVATKIICPHLTYTSRGIESRNKPQPTPYQPASGARRPGAAAELYRPATRRT